MNIVETSGKIVCHPNFLCADNFETTLFDFLKNCLKQRLVSADSGLTINEGELSRSLEIVNFAK